MHVGAIKVVVINHGSGQRHQPIQWGHTKLTIDAPRSGLANKYGADILAGAVAADYRKLRKLSDKDSAIHFAHENDYRWLTQWLAERDQPPIGKTCPKNWSTAPCRTP
jgi:hypothetical protein